MSYQIQIKEERRESERLASVVGAGKDIQLHATAEECPKDYVADDQFIMVVEWDFKSPYVTCLKGDYSKTLLRMFGWPEVTKEEYEKAVSEKAPPP